MKYHVFRLTLALMENIQHDFHLQRPRKSLAIYETAKQKENSKFDFSYRMSKGKNLGLHRKTPDTT